MTSTPPTKEQARQILRLVALNEICDGFDFSKFHTKVFCVFAHYGLLTKAKEVNFLSGNEWSNPSQKENLIERVEQFLIKHIK